MYKDIIDKIDLLKNATVIKQISTSNPDRTKLRVITNNKSYFVKIDYRIINNSEISSIKRLHNIYNELSIPTNQLIDIIVLKEFNCSVLIYEYIEGTDLENKNFSSNDIYSYGKQIGNYLLKLKLYNKLNNFNSFNLNEHLNNIIHKIQYLLLDKAFSDKIYSYFNNSEFKEIINTTNNLSQNILLGSLHIIHGDLKPGNIMVDKNNLLFIVDVDAYDLLYDIFNLKWHIFSILKPSINEYSFYKGFFKTYYNNNLPSDFNKQLIFITYYIFLEKISFFDTSQTIELDNFLSSYSELIKNISYYVSKFLKQIS